MEESAEQIASYNNQATNRMNELAKQSKKKLMLYGACVVAIVIVILAIPVVEIALRFKTPKLSLGANKTEFLTVITETNPAPCFNITFNTQVRVTNTNLLGSYKFESGVATFYHDGVVVGQVGIPEGRVGMKSTKNVGVAVSLSSVGTPVNPNLGDELGAGVLTLVANAVVPGKVEVMMKKKDSVAELNCFLILDLSKKMVRDMKCDL